MSSTYLGSDPSTPVPSGDSGETKLEAVVLPVSDVDRAKNFYQGLGWRLDADFKPSDDFRVVQLTPTGSACSIIFGTGVTSAVPRIETTIVAPRSWQRRSADGERDAGRPDSRGASCKPCSPAPQAT